MADFIEDDSAITAAGDGELPLRDDDDESGALPGRTTSGAGHFALYGSENDHFLILSTRETTRNGRSDTASSGENQASAGSSSNNADTGAEILTSAWAMPAESEIGWHIDAINAREVWADYTGRGIVVADIDNGWHSYNHPDLDDNIRFDLADMAAVNGQDHGQNTIGLIGAEANGSQSVGVAFNADLVPELWTTQGLIDAKAYADVMNNSWTFKNPLNGTVQANNLFAITDAVTTARGGLGAVVVFSAGNYRTEDIGGDILPMQSSPYAIVVGAANPNGTATWFSSGGSSLLTTAPGVNLFTTDGAAGTISNFAGTSGSAPIVSGAMALILEANPDLGFRDVQQIIAYSSAFNDQANATWQYNAAGNWNGGGLHFSTDHGFGLIDVLAATRLAETWQTQSTMANMQQVVKAQTVNLAIPDGAGNLQTSVTVAGGENIMVESITVNVDIDAHGEVGELILTLISPNGTEAVLMDTPMFGATGLASLDYTFAAQTFRGEEAQGNWTLRVEDTVGGNAGTLADWTLTLNGGATGADDTYYYNDQFHLYNGDAGRKTLTDGGGTDTINASMVTTGSNINLNAGANSTIDGTTLTIAGGTTIENVYGGDGNDTLTGNAADNLLWGGRGSDILDGGAGYDTAQWLEDFADFTISFSGAAVLAELAGSVIDTINNVEEFVFNGVSYLYTQLQTMFGGGVNDFAPVTTVHNGTLDLNATMLASAILSATDADGNPLTYEVWDGGKGSASAHFELDGVQLSGGQGHTMTQAEFDTLLIVGGASNGTETMWLRVSDGVHTTAWSQFTITTTAGSNLGTINHDPTATANNLTLTQGQSVLASTTISAADSDGDTLTYQVWDGGTNSQSGYFNLNGAHLSAGSPHDLTQAEFDALQIVGASYNTSETFWVRASDGEVWTGWKSFTLTTVGSGGVNHAPTVTAANLSLTQGQSVLASTVITAADADGNALTYEVWDGSSKSASGYFDLNGTHLSAGSAHSLTQAEFDSLHIVGGSQNDVETLWVRVSDGTVFTTWQSFALTTAGGGGGGSGNSAPTIAANSLTLTQGQSVLASTTISAADSDGDTLTYQVWDGGTNSQSGYFNLNGAHLSAGSPHDLTQAEFNALQIVGASYNTAETFWARASDGNAWTAWKSFTLTTSGGGAVNHAPVVAAGNLSLSQGQSVLASTAITVTDADGDTLTYEVWDDKNTSSSGYFDLNGARLSAGTGHSLTQAEFDSLLIVGGSTNLVETLWVRASDGQGFTAWKSFSLTTAGTLALDIEDILDMSASPAVGPAAAPDSVSAPADPAQTAGSLITAPPLPEEDSAPLIPPV